MLTFGRVEGAGGNKCNYKKIFYTAIISSFKCYLYSNKIKKKRKLPKLFYKDVFLVVWPKYENNLCALWVLFMV